MNIALVITAVLLSVAAAASATGKLSNRADVIETLTRVGVPKNVIPVLAGLELLGGLGLLAGIWSKSIGVAAAIGFALYFLGAVLAHVKAKDAAKELSPAAVLFLLALAVSVLEFAR